MGSLKGCLEEDKILKGGVKMKNLLMNLQSEETNAFADPAKANNGGGYSQPYHTFTFKGVKGSFSDESCGDFGKRYGVSYGDKSYEYNTMDFGGYETSDFDESDRDFLEAFKAQFGWVPPTEAELELAE